MFGEPEEDLDANEPEPEQWVKIQQNTFRNWVNNKLQGKNLVVEDVRKDFRNGVKLCRLMESLEGRGIGKVIEKKSMNHYESSGNLALALRVMDKQGIKLVNIGAEDIAGGNRKLILGMIWQLIRHYQIGSQTKLPPKQMMLSWINAVLHPHMTITNFSSDWNDGVALHGIIEYCRPGTCRSWNSLSTSDKFANCKNGMDLAKELMGIPQVISPEDFSSEHLDELSGMTYLSYFMMVDSPGFQATLKWVQTQIPHMDVKNFDTDWNDGRSMTELVYAMNVRIEGYSDLDYSRPIVVIDKVMIANERQMDVKPVLDAEHIVDPKVDHIGIMAYAAWCQKQFQLKGVTAPPPPPPPPAEPRPATPPPPRIPTPPPPSPPLHQVVHDPDIDVKIVETWRVHAPTTIEIDTTKQGPGSVTVMSRSPGGRSSELPTQQVGTNLYNATFNPEEKGHWTMEVRYDDHMIRHGPYDVEVYDPSKAHITTTNRGLVPINSNYLFEVDCQQTGLNEITVYVLKSGEGVQHQVSPANGYGRYEVQFVPREAGVHNVSIFCGGIEIPGSPFDVDAVDIQGVTAAGSGLRKILGEREAIFTVDTSTAPGRALDVHVSDPYGEEVHSFAAAMPDEQDKFEVKYTPVVAGKHEIKITYDDNPIEGSPFSVEVRAPQVYVKGMDPVAYIGRPSTFEIDASEMNKGTVEIDSDLPVRTYDKIAERKYRVTYVPKTKGQHDIDIIFAGKRAADSPYYVNVRDS